MTRKDYVMLAESFVTGKADALLAADNQDRRVCMEYGANIVAETLANRLAADNKAFDRDRFLTACGVK